MKTLSLTVCVILTFCATHCYSLIGTAAETRELSLEADSLFPKRRCVVEFQDGIPHGICRANDERGRLILTEAYANGKVHGKRICYYPNGQKFSEMNFENGLAEGETTTWFENGTIASIDHMHRGVPHGLQTLYFSNGSPSCETPHVNGVAHGTCSHYLPDSRRFGISTFSHGMETGQRVLIEPTAGEYQQILERGKFSALLKDHWPSASVQNDVEPLAGGEAVEVEWKGSWYPATVIRVEKRGTLIHYVGFDNSWDEYVTRNRIRSSVN
jgi:hypothetical protein